MPDASVDVAPNDGPLRLTIPPAGIKGDLIYYHEDEVGDDGTHEDGSEDDLVEDDDVDG